MSATSPLRILLVDDNPVDRMVAARALKRGLPGVELLEVEQPEEWARALATESFTLAIIDYQLGWSNGMELLRELKRERPHVPVLMLTGTAEELIAMELVRQGLDEYLTKTQESYSFLARSVRFTLERARQRRALRESEEMLRRIIEGAVDYAIFALDARGHIVTWNASAQRTTGYQEAEVVGRPFAELFELSGGDGLPLITRGLETARQAGVFHDEARLRRQGGLPFWAELTFSPLLDEGERLRGFSVVLRDISSRKEAEAERERLLATLDAERRRLGAVLDNLPVAVLLAEAPSGRIVQGNRQASVVLRHPAHDPQSLQDYARHWSALHPDGTPFTSEEYPLVRALRGETVKAEVLSYRLGDGTLGFLEASAAPIRDAQGQVVAAVVAFDDVTERRQAEEKLHRSAEFRERFLGVVSHDLRSPLQAIIVGAQLLMRNPGLPPGAARTAQRTMLNAERMARMISDLLDFTRGRLGGGIPVEPRSLDLFALCREVAEDQQLTHPGGRVEVETSGEGQGEWDADRLAQVVGNLVGNALRYGDTQVPVRVSVHGEGAERVRLQVSNQGRPIPPELLPTLFEPFRRAQTPGEQRSREGLGLGLFIVQQIVQAHGGTIQVRSTAEAGTTFTVELPRHARPHRPGNVSGGT